MIFYQKGQYASSKATQFQFPKIYHVNQDSLKYLNFSITSIKTHIMHSITSQRTLGFFNWFLKNVTYVFLNHANMKLLYFLKGFNLQSPFCLHHGRIYAVGVNAIGWMEVSIIDVA